ncbi:glycosyltransferase family 2 protein [Fulvivirgaceae bacterium BMA10]|uniref:Glycosyltransferase family 2 protein n=1 Tax=Splendidivirga corallicola TaxID=3051826 RepID=A0ABT8KID2_9BACT|nr:glycosyltransferase family 2 protein [Fulvivirgaceae bacterium BMA10]
MKQLEIIFWVLLFFVFYAFLGYGMFIYIWLKIRRLFKKDLSKNEQNFEPPVTLMIASYNEKDYLPEKVENSLALDYPKDKLRIVFITDGSDDGSPQLLGSYEGITVHHSYERQGKIAAINRGMRLIDTPFVIFSDANAMLNKEAVRSIIKNYKDPKVGCVAGEKRIIKKTTDSASGAGEGIYWRYESALKKMDSELCSVVGAAGELFSVRTELYEPVEPDTILDDFVMSLRITLKGYKIAYEPGAYAIESASASIKDEMKRKVRICAGGLQSIVRLKPLLNIFRYGTLSFQYVSHRVLRWTVIPLFLLLLIPINYALHDTYGGLYTFLFIGQLIFYGAALLGWYLENRQLRLKVLFIPFYFFIMNLAVFRGFFRYVRGGQSVLWERAKRA